MWRTATLCCLWTLAEIATAGEESNPKPDGPVIGIDLGTTYSCVGIYKNGRVEIIANEHGNRIMPSYVAFTDGGRLVGEAAKNQAAANPTSTIFDVKRFIGRLFKDAAVQKDAKFFPFTLVERNGKPAVSVQFKGEVKWKTVLEPEEISAMVLGRLKEIAATYLGQEVKHAVITVPAYFNDAQRAATRDAGQIAGLQVLKVINEPTAAAIAFGLDKKTDQTILVYDLGGGTLDVSILRTSSDVFEVVATNGDTRLGGEDFDQKVMQYLMKAFSKKHHKDISGDKQALHRLRAEVERVKLILSSEPTASVQIEALHEGIDLSASLTRATFEKINSELFQRTLLPVKQVLQDSGLQKSQIDEVVLVGGSTRIPKIQQLVKEFFDGRELARGVHPDEAVAHGAAIQAGMLGQGEDAPEATLVDVTSLTLGIQTVGGIMTKLIARNTALPCKNSTLFTTYRDNQAALDIQVYEGERIMTRNNHPLGTFQLSDIAPAPKGTPQIELTFNVDADGILSVEAEDKASGKSEKITISKDKSRLSVEQIEEMIKDAEEFAEEDQKLKAIADAKLAMEAYMHSMQSAAEGTNDKDGLSQKMDAEEKQTILGAVMDGQDWLVANPDAEAEEIQEKHQEIEGQCSAIISKYLGAGAGSSNSAEDDPADEL